MRVCQVVPYDFAEEGGVKRHALHLAETLRGAGDEVEIVAPLSRGEAPPYVRAFGGVVNIPANGSANHMAILTPPWSVLRFLRERRFDVVHLHEPLVPMLPYYALWFTPAVAHVATFHMYGESEPAVRRAARAALAKALFPLLDAAIAVSPAAADFAAPVWRRPLPVVPNGVPTSVFRPGGDERSGPDPGGLRLLFVGNWRDSRKGLPVLLDAYRRLREAAVACTLDVIGAGTPSDEQRRLPGVRFHGPISSEAMLAERYRQCDVFVAPATGQESFGIVLLEAMACGRPVVCSDILGYRGVIHPDGAVLVAPGDAAELARAIEALARAPERWSTMGRLNRARAEEFDWGRIRDQVRDIYLEAVERASHRGARRAGATASEETSRVGQVPAAPSSAPAERLRR